MVGEVRLEGAQSPTPATEILSPLMLGYRSKSPVWSEAMN